MLDNVPRLGDAPVPLLVKVLHALLHVGLDDAANLNVKPRMKSLQYILGLILHCN